MRDIKFRAWDKKTKKMRVVYCIVYDTYSQHSKDPKIKLVNLWGRIFPAYDDGECNTDIVIQREPKHVELMQYTGLKDKNGVEIYEGDIIKVDRQDTLFSIYIVGWHKERAMFSMTEHESDYVESFYDWVDTDAFTVIGNIYENPEIKHERG